MLQKQLFCHVETEKQGAGSRELGERMKPETRDRKAETGEGGGGRMRGNELRVTGC
jgi:hypothetical protein